MGDAVSQTSFYHTSPTKSPTKIMRFNANICNEIRTGTNVSGLVSTWCLGVRQAVYKEDLEGVNAVQNQNGKL